MDLAIEQGMKLQDALIALFAQLQREDGQDLIEYALLAALISVVSIVILRALGVQIVSIFGPIVTSLQGA